LEVASELRVWEKVKFPAWNKTKELGSI